jgi:hypothetical protein
VGSGFPGVKTPALPHQNESFEKVVQFVSLILGVLAVFVLLAEHEPDSGLVLKWAMTVVLLLSIGRIEGGQ